MTWCQGQSRFEKDTEASSSYAGLAGHEYGRLQRLFLLMLAERDVGLMQTFRNMLLAACTRITQPPKCRLLIGRKRLPCYTNLMCACQ